MFVYRWSLWWDERSNRGGTQEMGTVTFQLCRVELECSPCRSCPPFPVRGTSSERRRLFWTGPRWWFRPDWCVYRSLSACREELRLFYQRPEKQYIQFRNQSKYVTSFLFFISPTSPPILHLFLKTYSGLIAAEKKLDIYSKKPIWFSISNKITHRYIC